MSKRKISECINVRIAVGNYQHIEITKYAEEEIEFSSTKERVEKEDALRADVVENLIRSMKAIPERLGKGIENAIEVEEAIKKKIPEWLANDPIPNVANGALKINDKVVLKQKADKDKAIAEKADKEEKLVDLCEPRMKPCVVKQLPLEKLEEASKREVTAKPDEAKPDEAKPEVDESELFEADKVDKVEVKKPVKEEKVKDSSKDNDFFDEDDIFDEGSK
jgi:hypothetical protein